MELGVLSKRYISSLIFVQFTQYQLTLQMTLMAPSTRKSKDCAKIHPRRIFPICPIPIKYSNLFPSIYQFSLPMRFIADIQI